MSDSILGDDLLRGEKVRLTLPREDDLDLLTTWFSSDFAMMRRLGSHPVYPKTRKDEEDWLQCTIDNANRFTFVIRTLDENDMIGVGTLFDVDWRSRHAELGITLGASDKRGQGFGRDAVQVLLRYGFMELNLHRVYLMVQGENIRAIKSYENAGFVHEGAVREAMLREGRHFDLICMSILRHEWRAS